MMGVLRSRWMCCSMRDLFGVLILLVFISTMITVHMNQYLPWQHTRETVNGQLHSNHNLKKHKDYRADLMKNLNASSGHISNQLLRIIDRLAQTDEKSLPDLNQPFILLAEGSLSAIRHEVPLIESAFNRYGVDVKFHVTDEGGKYSQHRKLREVEGFYDGMGWSLLMCLNSSNPTEACYDTADRTFLKENQRVNVIQELQEILLSPDSLCEQTPEGKLVTSEELDCAVYPDEKQKLSVQCTNQSFFRLKKTNSIAQPNFINCSQLQNTDELKRFLESREMVVKLPSSLHLLGEQPMVAVFHVLVMSFSPLRLYLHPEAMAWEGFNSYIHKKPQRAITVTELQSVISEIMGEERSNTAISQLEDKIVTSFIRLEALHWKRNKRIRCPSCFQLLEVVTVFNSTFYPYILQIKSSVHQGKQASLNEYLVRQNILEDMAAMLVSKDSFTIDVAKGLEELKITEIGEDSKLCNKEQTTCLCDDDILYLLKNRQEHMKIGKFKKLYPNRSSVRYSRLLQDSEKLKNNGHHTTGSLHSFLLSLERFFANLDKEDTVEMYDDMNIPIDSKQPVKNGVKMIDKPEVKKYRNDGDIPGKITKPPCDKDTASMPYLSHLSTLPKVELIPEFSPLTTDYEAEVTYDVMLLTVVAFAKSCSSQARISDKQGDRGISNVTLGIGENKIWIFIVDTSHSDTWVVNTYTILITRYAQMKQLQFSPSYPHKICSLKQDCSLKFTTKDSCGLQHYSTHNNWKTFTEDAEKTLPFCSSGNSPGEWYIPCGHCKDFNSCYWKEAKWQPKSCKHKILPREELKECMVGKKVLFIGDSTNRGIMHYITEQVSGTLQDWDKTHNMKIYSHLNNNRTMFSFAYYPQFWLPAEHRPVFDKALFQLIKRSMPLQNNTNTVLMIGGVHWLGRHHINLVKKALIREGLTGIKLVLKGLGAGFHQPVSGVHCLSQTDHEKLYDHNRVLLDYAVRNGFHVVDTFNMTMARYKDFLQGKCACHFHRVSTVKRMDTFKSSKNFKLAGHHQPAYHVEGEINAVYSEITVNEICRPD